MERARNNLLWILSLKTGGSVRTAPASTPADAALLLSLQHAQAHRYQECVDAARQALKLNPRMAEAYNNLGFCYASLQKWDEGIENIREALKIMPDFPLASGNLSWMLAEKAKAGARVAPR